MAWLFGRTPGVTALEEQRNGEWRYLEFLQVTSLIAGGPVRAGGTGHDAGLDREVQLGRAICPAR